MANPVGPGTLTPITLQGGGTISGSLSFDATGAVGVFDIVETGGAFGGFNFTDFEFTNANSRATFGTFSFGNFTLSSLDIRTTGALDYTSNVPGGRDLGLTFDAIPAVIPAGGVALTICTDLGRVCGDPASGINIPSGELIRNPTQADQFNVAGRNVTGGFFTVSDPPGSISLNFSLDPVLIPVDTTGGGGTGTPVPEPATMSLFALGAALTMGAKRNRRKGSLEA